MIDKTRWSADSRGVVCFAEKRTDLRRCEHGKYKPVVTTVYAAPEVTREIPAVMPKLPIGDGLFVLMVDMFGDLRWRRLSGDPDDERPESEASV